MRVHLNLYRKLGLAALCLIAAAAAFALLRSDSATVQAQTAPTVTAVAITSSAGTDHTYALGQTIEVTLTFSEAVAVSGSPQLAIDMDPADWGTKWAAYRSGSAKSSIVFAHTVVKPNYSTQGIAVLANTLKLNGGSIASASSGTAAALAHSGLGHDANHKVNWQLSPPVQDPEPPATPTPSAPTVPAVAITSDPGEDHTYANGEVIEVSVAFSEAVTVNGTPQIAIDMDPADWGTKWAGYKGGSGSNTLTFAYTVVEPNISTQGVAVLANTLKLNGGGIVSSASGAAANLAHAGLPHDANYKVDWRLSPEPVCDLVAPSSVSAVTVGQGAVVSWTLPADLSDACEVTGLVISAASETADVGMTAVIDDPTARNHTFIGLTPGGHVFTVRVTYSEDHADEFQTSYFTDADVPDACITLAIKPYARGAVSGRITSVNGDGCQARQTFDLERKRSSDTEWSRYSALPWRFIDTQSDPSQPHFIFYGLEPNVGYDFRIVAYDASNTRYATDAQSVTLTAQDPSETADANSPTGLRFVTNNDGDLSIRWDAFTAPAGRTLTEIVVQWKACPEPNDPNGCTGSVSSATKGATDTSHAVLGLAGGSFYTARVAAKTHANGQPASTATEAWSVWAPAVRIFFEPMQAWFFADTPTRLAIGGRTFMNIDVNKEWGYHATCVLTTGSGSSKTTEEINCPAETLVSLVASGNESVNVVIRDSISTELLTTTEPQEGTPAGPPAIEIVRASGGAAPSDGNPSTHEGRILIYSSVGSTNTNPGTIASYGVQSRKQNANGTWPSWPSAWTEDTNLTERYRTISGLADGTYQVRVRSRTDNTEDHDDDPMTPDQTVSRYGFTSEVVTVTVDASHTGKALPFPITMTSGDRKISVEWGLLDYGSVPIAYQVRHRQQGTSAWTESDVMHPRATTLNCRDIFDCFNPRRYEITDLIRLEQYEVELRARNANGWSEWHSRVVTAGPPDTAAPVAQSAVNAGGQRTVVITFNEPLNPAFQPNASRFQLGRQDKKYFTVLAKARATHLSISGSQLTVTFSQIPSDATHIEYIITNFGPIQDYTGNVTPSFRTSLTRN